MRAEAYFSKIKSVSPPGRGQIKESTSTKNLKESGVPLKLLSKNKRITSALEMRHKSPQPTTPPELNSNLSEKELDEVPNENKYLKKEGKKIQLKKNSVSQGINKALNQQLALKSKEKSTAQLNPQSVNTSLHLKNNIDGVRITLHSPRLLNKKFVDKVINSPKFAPDQIHPFSCSKCNLRG